MSPRRQRLLAALALIAVTAFVVIAAMMLGPGYGAVIAMVLLVGGLLALQQRRYAKANQLALRRLREVQRADRKDASRWEWRIARTLETVPTEASVQDSVVKTVRETASKAVDRAVREAVSQTIAPALQPSVIRGMEKAAEASKRRRTVGHLPEDVTLLGSAGIFDRRYYEATQRRTFPDDTNALLHFVTVGMPALIGPNPLLAPARLPGEVREAYQDGDVPALLEFLKRPLASMPPLSGFFSPSLVEATDKDTAAHPGGCLGWFRDSARETDLLPSRTTHARWGQFRAAIADTLVEHRRTWRVSDPRWSPDWDEAAEQAWKAGLDATIEGPDSTEVTVSVIMPVWNRGEVVADAIASVRAQGWEDWELIVIDDGSDDSTPGVLASISSEDPRITVLTTEHAGVSAARNLGLSRAHGRRVAFLDSDNRWRPDFLRTALAAMDRGGLRAAYAAAEVHQGDSVRYRAFDGGRDELLAYNHIDLNVLVVERSLAIEAGGFDESLRRWVDHDFALHVSEISEPVLLPFIGCEYADFEDDQRITHREGGEWEFVVLDKAWSQWGQAGEYAASRVPGRVSVVVPTKDDVEMTVRAVRAVCATTRDADVEVIVVDNGSSLATRIGLVGALSGEPRVRIVHIHRNLNFSTGSNVGLTRSTGELVLFLNNDTVVRDGWLEPLVRQLTDPAVIAAQPLLVYPDESIQTAGTVWAEPDGLPVHFLAHHPPEDARTVGSHEFPAVTAAAMLIRASDALRVRGFDPRYRNGMEDVDLCLRLSEERPGMFRVVPESVVVHEEGRTPGRSASKVENRRLFLDRWRGRMPEPNHAIFASRHLVVERVDHDTMEVPTPRPVIVRDRAGAPRRWGIRHAAVGGDSGDRWGDTAFAESLADALRVLGQEVVTYRHGPNAATAGIHDDVSILLRGKDQIAPLPGIVNILWVISHPDAVTDEELRGFELAYAASGHWARQRSMSSGRHVGALLQCTDARRFTPAQRDLWPTRPATFVGGVHPGRRRRVVSDALAAGIDLRVIGGGWQGTLPSHVLESEHVANTDLPAVYQSSFRVLADHWPRMAEEGFIQNRVFDAVACGAPVVSDPVTGLQDVFGDAVAVYRTPEELTALCAPHSDHPARDIEARVALARRIRTQHSFDARARELLAAVEGV